MRFMLDTNCCVHLFADTKPELARRVGLCAVGDIVLSSIVLAELRMGAAKGYGPDPATLDAFLLDVPVLSFDEAAAAAYGSLPFKRARFDRLLAGHVLSLDLILVTADERDFADIPDLKIENWTKP